MHHGFSLSWSNDCLVQDWRIEAPHRHGTTVSWAAHGNVFSRGFGFELACDAHRAVPFENLHTELVIAQRALPARPFRSGGKRGRGLHAARSNVYWNVRFEFSQAAPEQVSIEGFSEWPRAVFRGWRGNRALLMRAAPGLAQSLGELNVTPRIANLYEHQRAASRRPLERR